MCTTSEHGKAEVSKCTVHWIDDCSGQIFNIAAGAMSFLWDEGVISKIYLFGDGNWQDGATTSPSEYNEKNLNKTLTQIFRAACIEHDRVRWHSEGTTYRERRDYISVDKDNGLATIVRVIQSSSEDSPVSALMKVWSDPEKLKTLKTECDNASINQEKLKEKGFGIDALMDQIKLSEGDAIALDVLLMRHDSDRITKQRLPSISMAIYDWCQSNSRNCYVYSHYSFDDELVNAWKSVYREVFSSNEPKTIYMENHLTKNEKNTDTDALLHLVKGE